LVPTRESVFQLKCSDTINKYVSAVGVCVCRFTYVRLLQLCQTLVLLASVDVVERSGARALARATTTSAASRTPTAAAPTVANDDDDDDKSARPVKRALTEHEADELVDVYNATARSALTLLVELERCRRAAAAAAAVTFAANVDADSARARTSMTRAAKEWMKQVCVCDVM
jgi:hypothetical protein